MGRGRRGWTAVLLDGRGTFDAGFEAALAVGGIRVVGRARSAAGTLSLLGRRRPNVLIAQGSPEDARWPTSLFLRRAYEIDPELQSVLLGDGALALEEALLQAAAAAAGVPADDGGGEDDPPRLTRREREVLRLAGDGLSNTQISRLLWVTRDTVKFHLGNVYRKLGVATRLDAARAARELGLLEDEGQLWPRSLPVTAREYDRRDRSAQATSIV